MKRLLYLIATLIGIGASVALAQQVVIQALTGNEAVLGQAGGPGGTGFFTNVAALRGGKNYQPLGTGTTVTGIVSPNVEEVVVTGAITTLNLSLPAAPFDGQTVTLACPGGTVSTLVLSAAFGGTTNNTVGPVNPATIITGLNPSACTTTVQVSASMTYTYQATPSTWFRVQ